MLLQRETAKERRERGMEKVSIFVYLTNLANCHFRSAINNSDNTLSLSLHIITDTKSDGGVAN